MKIYDSGMTKIPSEMLLPLKTVEPNDCLDFLT